MCGEEVGGGGEGEGRRRRRRDQRSHSLRGGTHRRKLAIINLSSSLIGLFTSSCRV